MQEKYHICKLGSKVENKQFFQATPAITLALSVSIRMSTANFEQQELCKLAELFIQRDLGCTGRLIKVHGDLQLAT